MSVKWGPFRVETTERVGSEMGGDVGVNTIEALQTHVCKQNIETHYKLF
jgi:hypothetical protein